jgi:ABC-type branched-subunit amino acid transport system substrate-binding protein
MKRFIVVALCAALFVAGCGRSGSSSSQGTGTSSTTAAGTAAAKSGTFGSVTDVCQPGTPSGSPTTGVSPTEIRAAVFSDAGFSGRPGLNQEFFDTAKVFSQWCNDRGGINGRKIVVDQRDAALFNVKARMVESCAQDFAMVGGGAVFDQDGVETRLQCLLPDISGFVVSAPARGADLVVQPLPNPTDELAMGSLNYLDQKFPAATKKVGVLTGDVQTTKVTAAQMTEAAKALGWNIVYNDAYPAAGVTDWTPYAQKLKDNGVKGLIWVGDPDALSPLLGAIRDIGYQLDFIRTDANHYDQNLIRNAGTALAPRNLYIQSAFHPFEHAAPSSATGQYLKAFEQYLPNGKKQTYLGLQAWSSWLLFTTAAASCGNDLTRRCMYEAAKKVHTWTGGGLHATSDPGAGKATQCYLVMRAAPTGFTVANDTKPNQGIFNCSPKNVFALPAGEAVRTTLADVGQSIDNMK